MHGARWIRADRGRHPPKQPKQRSSPVSTQAEVPVEDPALAVVAATDLAGVSGHSIRADRAGEA
ncbi:hypothetical protein CEJ63_23700, partial [Acinetobacter baumannii]